MKTVCFLIWVSLLQRSVVGREIQERIYGGTGTYNGEYKGTAYIYHARSRYFCGGAIVGQRYVITAAHCFDTHRGMTSHHCSLANVDIYPPNSKTKEQTPFNDETLQIYDIVNVNGQLSRGLCGITHVRDPWPWLVKYRTSDVTQGRYTGRVTPISYLIIHEDYKRATMKNDIAVIRTERKIMSDWMVEPLELPDKWLTIPETELIWIAGWGISQFDPVQFPNFQQVIPIKEVNKSLCDAASIHLGDGQMCATAMSENTGVCYGDDGTPVWYRDRILLAILSSPGEAAIYTFIPYYVDWIHDVQRRYADLDRKEN